MSKRNDPAIRPARVGEWTLRHASNEAASGWDNLCRQQPGPIASLYDRLIRDPRAVDNAERQGRLKGSLSTAVIKGKPLEQWQYEVAGGGRVWYAVSDADTIVWITKASARHPNETK